MKRVFIESFKKPEGSKHIKKSNHLVALFRLLGKTNKISAMKRTKVIATTLIFSILLNTLPLGSFSVSAAEYNIWVGGVKITDTNKSNITGDGITGSVSYDSTTNTLTLDNAAITGYYSTGILSAGIYTSVSDLNIVLIGTNTISITPPGNSRAAGIFGGTNLNISGNKNLVNNLTIVTTGATQYGGNGILMGLGTITIDGCTVEANGGDIKAYDGLYTSYGIGVLDSAGKVSIKDANVIAKGYPTSLVKSIGLVGLESITVENSTVQSIGNNQAMWSNNIYAPNTLINGSTNTAGTDPVVVAPNALSTSYKYILMQNYIGTITAPPSVVAAVDPLTLVEPTLSGTATSKGWEIKRPGYDTWSTYNTSSYLFYYYNGSSLRFYAVDASGTKRYSNVVQVTVTPYPCTLTLTASPSAATYGQDVVLTAKVTGDKSLQFINFSFYNGTTRITGAQSDTQGQASITIIKPATGTYNYNVKINEGGSYYGQNTASLEYTVSKLEQATIGFNYNSSISTYYGASQYTMPGMWGGSGTGAVTYRSSNPEVASVSGDKVTFTGAGSAIIYGKKLGDANYNDSPEKEFTISVTPRNLSIYGAAAESKTYDGTKTAYYDQSALYFGTGGIINNDDVSIDFTNAEANFQYKEAFTNQSVYYTGFALKGADSNNYVVSTQPASTRASIYRKAITISGITANDKVYDGTGIATLNIPPITTAMGLVEGDSLTVTGNGYFSNANASSEPKSVSIYTTYAGALTIGGSSAFNYQFAASGNQTSTTARILPATLTVTPEDVQYKYYGQSDSLLKYITSGLVAGETPIYNETYTRDPGEEAGFSFLIDDLSVTLSNNGKFLTSNYDFVYTPKPVTFEIRAYNPEATATASADGDNGWFTITPVTLTAPAGYKISTSNALTGNTWADSITINGTDGSGKSATYYLQAATGEYSGSISTSKTFDYKVDATAPTGDIKINENSVKKFINEITFGLFFDENIDVTITADDATSGVASIKYYKSSVILNSSAVSSITGWTDYTGTITETVQDAAKFVYYVKVTDNAGNITYFASTGTIFDTSAPVITGVTDGNTYYVDQTVMVTDASLDTLTLNDISFLSGGKITGNKNATYTLVATDRLGNSTTYTIYTKTIASLSTTIDSIDVNNVKSSDKTEIETVKSNVEAVLLTTGNGASQAQINELNAIKTKCTSLLAKIQDVKDKIADVDTKTDGITVDNVNSGNKANLDSALATINTLLASSNLIADERTALTTKKAEVEGLLGIISDISTKIAAIRSVTDGVTLDNVKSSQKTDLENTLPVIEELLLSTNLTSAERTALETLEADVPEFIQRIDDTADKLANVGILTSGLTTANVNSGHKTDLESAKTIIESIGSGNLTADESTALATVSTNVSDMLAKIQDVKDKIADVDTKTDGITADNVNSGNKANLDSVLATINTLLASGNLTADERTALTTKKAEVEALLGIISNISTKIAAISSATDGVTIDNVKSSQKTDLEDTLPVIEELLETTNLTTEERLALLTLQAEIPIFIQRIDDTAASLADIAELTSGLTTANVNSGHETDLESAKTKIESIGAGNLTTDESTALATVSTNVTNMLAKIQDVKDKIADVDTKTDGITADNVKSSDKIALESALATIEDLLLSNNLTTAERLSLSSKGTEVEGLLGIISDISTDLAAVISVTEGVTIDNVKSSQKSDLEGTIPIIEELLATNNLTTAEREALETLQVNVPEFIQRIEDTAANLADIAELTEGLSTANVNSGHKTDLESAKTIIESIGAGNLTTDESTALATVSTNVTDMLAKIQDVKDKIADVDTKTDGITADNVNSGNKANLDSALATINALLASSNLTAEERTALTTKKAEVEALLAKIEDTKDKIAEINTKTEGITTSNVNNSDKTDLESAKSIIAALLAADNLTADERTALTTKQTEVIGLLNKIATTAEKITEINTLTSGISLDNVKSSDQTDLDSAMDIIEDLLAEGNLTADERTALTTKQTEVTGLLDKIAATADKITEVNTLTAGISLDNVKSSDQTHLDSAMDIIEELLAADNLTADERTALTTKQTEVTGLLDKITDTAEDITNINTLIDGITTANVKSSDQTDLDSALSAINTLLGADNITAAERTALTTKKSDVTDLKNKITEINEQITGIEDLTDGITVDNAKSSDKEALEDALLELEDILASNNLTEAERSTLEGIQDIAEATVARIETIAAIISDARETIESVTEDNVTLGDKTGLEDAKSDLEELLDTYGDNLTDSEKLLLEERIADAEKYLERIAAVSAAVEAALDKIDGITEANATMDDKTALEEGIADLRDILLTYADNLSENDKLALETRIAEAEKALIRIDVVAKAIADAGELAKGITEANATINDRTGLEKAKAAIKNILDIYGNNLTTAERSAFEQRLAETEKALVRIDFIAKTIADAKNRIKNINENNVEKSDRTSLDKSKTDFENLLNKYGNNLTESEKSIIRSMLVVINNNLKILDQVEAVEKLIGTLPSAGNVKKTDESLIRKVEGAYAGLTDHQKELVDLEAAAKLKAVSEALRMLLELYDQASGTRLEGVDGTQFDARTELVVTKVKESLGRSILEKFAVNVKDLTNGKVITELYDIKMLLEGKEIQPDGKIRITLKLTEEQMNYKDLEVVYIADDGTVEVIPCEVNGDEVTFVTDHLSYYGIVGTKVDGFPWYLLALLLIIPVGVGIKKRKDQLEARKTGK